MTGICARNFSLGGKDVRTKTWRPEREEREKAGKKFGGKGLDKHEVVPSFPSFTPCLAGRIYTTLSLFFPLLHPSPHVRPSAYARACRGEKVKKGKEGSGMIGRGLIGHPIGEVL